MREKSIEAMENRKHRDRVRMRAKREAKTAAKRAEVALAPNKYLGPKLFKGPPLPPMSKSELRAMFAQAMQNTARMSW